MRLRRRAGADSGDTAVEDVAADDTDVEDAPVKDAVVEDAAVEDAPAAEPDTTVEPEASEPDADATDAADTEDAGQPDAAPAPTMPVTPPARRGTSAASAASRARRIGGRPTPAGRGTRPTPAGRATTVDTTAGSAAAATPSLTKPTSAKPAPAKAAPAKAGAARPARPGRPAPRPGPAKAARPTQTAEDDDAAATPAQRRARRAVATAWAPVAVLVLVLAALAWVAFGPGGPRLVASRIGQPSSSVLRDEVVASVKSAVPAIISYDYRNLDQDTEAATALGTATFDAQYVQTMDTLIRPQAPAAKSVQVCSVATAGLVTVSGDGNQAVVLVFAQVSVTNSTTGTTPRLDLENLQVTVNHVGSRWLVDSIKTI